MLQCSIIVLWLLVSSSCAVPTRPSEFENTYDDYYRDEDFTVRQMEFVPEEPDEEMEAKLKPREILLQPDLSIDHEEFDSPSTSSAEKLLDPTTLSDLTTTMDLTTTSDPITTSEATSSSEPTTTLKPTPPLRVPEIIRVPIIPVQRPTAVLAPLLPTLYTRKLEMPHYLPFRQAFVPLASYSAHFNTPVFQTPQILTPTTYVVRSPLPWSPANQMQQVVPLPYTKYQPFLPVQSHSIFDYSSQMPLPIPPLPAYYPSYEIHQNYQPMKPDDGNLSLEKKIMAEDRLHDEERISGIFAGLHKASEANENFKRILSEAYADAKQVSDEHKSILEFLRNSIDTLEIRSTDETKNEQNE